MWLVEHLNLHFQLVFRGHIIFLLDSAGLSKSFPFEVIFEDSLINFLLSLATCMEATQSVREISFLLDRHWRITSSPGAQIDLFPNNGFC